MWHWPSPFQNSPLPLWRFFGGWEYDLFLLIHLLLICLPFIRLLIHSLNFSTLSLTLNIPTLSPYLNCLLITIITIRLSTMLSGLRCIGRHMLWGAIITCWPYGEFPNVPNKKSSETNGENCELGEYVISGYWTQRSI